MKLFATVLLLSMLSVLAKGTAIRYGSDRGSQPRRAHEEWSDCGTWCESTCDHPPNELRPCIAMCRQGYVCESGYIRETDDGRCILPSQCPPLSQHRPKPHNDAQFP